MLRWNKTPSKVLSLRTARGLAQPCLSRDTGTPHLVAARWSSYFWKVLRISEMTLGSSRVVVSPRSCPLLVMIFLSSLLITFPDLVLGRRFTTWQRQVVLGSGQSPLCQCLLIYEPNKVLIPLQPDTEAEINPKDTI